MTDRIHSYHGTLPCARFMPRFYHFRSWFRQKQQQQHCFLMPNMTKAVKILATVIVWRQYEFYAKINSVFYSACEKKNNKQMWFVCRASGLFWMLSFFLNTNGVYFVFLFRRLSLLLMLLIYSLDLLQYSWYAAYDLALVSRVYWQNIDLLCPTS